MGRSDEGGHPRERDFIRGRDGGISETTFNDIVGEVPSKELEKNKLDGAGLPLVELLVHSGLCPSKDRRGKTSRAAAFM